MTNTTTTEQVLDDIAQRFLASLASHGLVTAAAAAAGISPQAAYKRRARSELFAAQWDQALELARERIATALKHTAQDKDTAARMLADVTDRLRNPDLSPDDRRTLLHQLDAIAARIDQLRGLANSEAAKAHVRRRDEARAKLREDARCAIVVAAEFDEAVKQLDPHWKRLLFALEDMRRTAVRAEVECPSVALDTMLRIGLSYGCPEFAEAVGLLRADRRHRLPFEKFVAKRVPGEVAP